jgi:hypothetical protein
MVEKEGFLGLKVEFAAEQSMVLLAESFGYHSHVG